MELTLTLRNTLAVLESVGHFEWILRRKALVRIAGLAVAVAWLELELARRWAVFRLVVGARTKSSRAEQDKANQHQG